MKFKDPLASMHFIGGTLPNHLAMMGFAIYVHSINTIDHRKDLNCAPGVNFEVYDEKLRSVKIMIIAHVVYIILYLAKRGISKSNGMRAFLKINFDFVGIVVYFTSFLWL